jgi:hypothetical protein
MWLLLLLTIGIFGYVFVGIARSIQIQEEDRKDAIEKWKKQARYK